MAGSCYVSTMARKPNWSRELPAPVVPTDSAPMGTLRDIAGYMETLGARFERRAWQRACDLLLDAAERGGPVEPVRRQTMLALLLDGRLDVKATDLAE